MDEIVNNVKTHVWNSHLFEIWPIECAGIVSQFIKT